MNVSKGCSTPASSHTATDVDDESDAAAASSRMRSDQHLVKCGRGEEFQQCERREENPDFFVKAITLHT